MNLSARGLRRGHRPGSAAGGEERAPRLLAESRSTVPPVLCLAVEKALAKDPADRYQAMRELVVDLRRLVRQSDASEPLGEQHRGWVMVAVLPFRNLSTDPEQEYFSDGLTEETIGSLGQMSPDRIRVIARTSDGLQADHQDEPGRSGGNSAPITSWRAASAATRPVFVSPRTSFASRTRRRSGAPHTTARPMTFWGCKTRSEPQSPTKSCPSYRRRRRWKVGPEKRRIHRLTICTCADDSTATSSRHHFSSRRSSAFGPRSRRIPPTHSPTRESSKPT